MRYTTSNSSQPPPPRATHERSPFHPGEQALQTRAGVRDHIERIGRRIIHDSMPDQHRAFFAELPFVVVGALDGRSRPWASVLTGAPGFMSSPDPQTLRIEARPGKGDPIDAGLRTGAPVGLLGIQPETRRRNRVNGAVVEAGERGFVVRVDQSFGNCPQYIQARAPVLATDAAAPRHVRAEGALLSAAAAALAGRADTFFIASALPGARRGDSTEGVDVSHRGGKPGFVRVSQENGRSVLTSPDFVGNLQFNTFGNLLLNPLAGIVFVDFASGHLLSLTGEAEVVWDGPEVAAFVGAERLLRFRVTEGVWIENAVPLRWSAPEWAPQLAATGSWADVVRAAAAAERPKDFRSFVVARIEDESDTVRSFYLAPADGEGLAYHQPGQFLPLALDIAGFAAPVRRTYTLSDEPNARHYRISVKREAASGRALGIASNWLHENVRVGSRVRAMAPRGNFVLDPGSRRRVLLLSAGVGVTPMVAMLNHLMGGTEQRMRYPHRRVKFVHAARHGGEHAFGAHVRALARERPTLTVHVRYSAPRPQDISGRDYDSAGRIDAELLRSLLPLDNYDVYLCGPAGFMQSMYDILLELGVRDERIRWEAFGPARLERRGRRESAADRRQLEPARAATVEFRASRRTIAWDHSRGTLLDLAEASGIDAPWGCRSGACGTCAARVLDGVVTYSAPPAAEHSEGLALTCSAVPASARLTLDL